MPALALILCLLVSGCWKSTPGFFDLSRAVQPLTAGTYTETDLSQPKPAAGKKPETRPVFLVRDGEGYRAQWGVNGEMMKVFLVPLDAEAPSTLIYEAQDVSCAEPDCAGQSPPVYVGLLRLLKDGSIERIEPEQADPDLVIAKAAGASCDDQAICSFNEVQSLKRALKKLAAEPANFLYTPQ
ncbi:MAG TPA: hypothetical protein VEH07_09025 [Alphaproteobacteria bacterium]|nr:hypothetical protein [Alphaproteobacteria bacterium]